MKYNFWGLDVEGHSEVNMRSSERLHYLGVRGRLLDINPNHVTEYNENIFNYLHYFIQKLWFDH